MSDAPSPEAALLDPDMPVVVALEGGLLLADPAAEARLARLTRTVPTPPSGLPLNNALLRWSQDQIAAGRSLVVLERGPDGMAAEITSPSLPVISPSAFPSGRFLWIGPALAPSPSALRLDPLRAFPLGESRAAALWRALRPHHWSKNLLVFLPLIAAHKWAEPAIWAGSLAALLAFCLATSSVYLVNDMLDLADDRAHPDKRRRPLAAGHLSLRMAAVTALLLMTLALGLAAVTGPGLLVTVLAYGLAASAYSLRFKRIPFLDVLWLAGLYIARVLAGAAATGIWPTGWLIAFCGCLMGALACAKRCAELYATPERAASRGYRPQNLRWLAIIGLTASVGAVVILVLHALQPETGVIYARPGLLLPVAGTLALWQGRIWAIVTKGRLNADPVLFALRDWPSWLAFATLAGLFMAAAF